MFEKYDGVVTDLLVLSVLQLYGVVSHTQQRDDEVDQSQDAVEPQEAVPASHKNTSELKEYRRCSASQGSGLYHEI